MPTFDEGEATGGHTQNPAKMACVQSTTRSGSFSDDMSELDEVKQKQDELIMRLTEHNNALLKNYVSNLESCLCKLQAQLGHAIQSGGMVSLETLQRTLPDERSASMDVPGVQFENGAEHQEIADSEAVESVILKKHAHCTAEICWRQKYTESMGQLQAVLVELKAELEEKTIPECEAENPNTKHQSKVQIIEESIHTLHVNGQSETIPREQVTKKSRLQSLLGLDPSLRRMKLSRTSESQSSLAKAPLIKRLLNFFKKKPHS